MVQGQVRGDVQKGDDGLFVDKYSDDAVLQALFDHYPEPLTNKEVAEAVDCSKPTAHNRLHDLADEGRVFTKKPGANARVWWVDKEQPGREVEAMVEDVEELDRHELITVAPRFDPPFNPTQTSTGDIVDFLLEQRYGDLERALTEHRD